MKSPFFATLPDRAVARRSSHWRGSVVGIFSLIALWLAGCQPADPLDRKVDAATPADYNSWVAKTLPTLPENLAREFAQAIARIKEETPQFHTLRNEREFKSQSNPLCRQIDRRTLRQVIVAGCEASNVTLLRRIKLESDELLALMKRGESATVTAASETRLDQLTDFRRKALDALRAQVEANRQRIKELSAPRS